MFAPPCALFMLTVMAGQLCVPPPAHNRGTLIRDVGGLRVPGGRIRTGRLFRYSGGLLEEADFDALAGHGVRLVVDLRGVDEGRGPLEAWAARHGVEYHRQPIEVARPELLAAWGSGLSGDEAEVWLRDVYLHLVDDHGHRLAATLGALSRSLPAAFGCSAGKDRTGLVTALLQSLLGAGRDDIARHYSTVPPSPDRLAPLARRWRSQPDRRLSPGSRTILGAPPERILVTLDHVTARQGGVEAYLRDAGLDVGAVERLRRALVEPV